MLYLTNAQARRFLLRKHGLLGKHCFIGKQGLLAYVRQTGCIQFDPVDVCGKNPELVLQSRVKGFTKETLSEALYTDRVLFDFPDKNLSIIPMEDWPYFARFRQAAVENERRFPDILGLKAQTRLCIEARGAVNSDELKLAGDVRWHSAIHWSNGSNASRAALEHMYSTGELVIHHKKGARKYYDLAERHVPDRLRNARDPLPVDEAHNAWRVLRRIGAVGLLWNKPSDAFLGIWGLNAADRARIFGELLAAGQIIEVSVEGLKDVLYARSEDAPLLAEAQADAPHTPRCELLAPLDCFLWDRKLIQALFGFAYKWEIYTPAAKRAFGYYVLPLLYGDSLVGRVEAANDTKAKMLVVKNVWFEANVTPTKKMQAALEACLARFARFNGCKDISFS